MLTHLLSLQTVFILNPKPPSDCGTPCYGYRSGLSTTAMHALESMSAVRHLDDPFFSHWYSATQENVYHVKAKQAGPRHDRSAHDSEPVVQAKRAAHGALKRGHTKML